MGIEYLICVVGAVVIIYFMAKPQSDKPKKDKLTNELHSKGLPPQAPWEPWNIP